MQKIPMTATGYHRLEAELKNLKSVERPSVIRAISEAREHGDLSENAEYHAAKERQGWIGATVVLADEDTDEESTYQLVGADEADIKAGLLSITAPLARALVGKSSGETVEVSTPSGAKAYEIVSVAYK
jgi:transcription elongation factor GreA